ncbi:MAG: HAD family hydrolase [Bacteroidetes bacterium]|nr:HAD family hydrolase [Bacteroidota bacterium]MBU1681105.1 HAD family hydrolase [Bacteroidota bacterium]MBU2507199.1 HAD family hydrolase [Bacteroidota bacterium]
MGLAKYKHIIWDWNGTLFNDAELCCSIMNHLLTKRNMNSITLQDYKSVFTFPVRDYYQKVGHDVSDENWEVLSYEFINEYESRKNECGLYQHAVEVLEFIDLKGISQSVLSAYSQSSLEEIVKSFNLDKYFIKLVGLNNIYAASKLENGKKWMSELGFENSEVLLIGDTVHDFEVAEEIGADCLLISNGHQNKNKLVQSSAIVINSISEILSN